ncbi:MAG: cation diffusion facilitator family transporter [Opitutaceae bacterium]
MSHSGHHHSHATDEVSDAGLLGAVIVNAGLSFFEFVAGFFSGSVALMADALHNTNDAAALLIAYIARKISRKEADGQYTFGYRRAELIGAMIQLTALILVGCFLVFEAVKRFFAPEPLLGGWMMAAAGIALIVDLVTAWFLWSMAKGSLNVRAAFLHNLSDAGASVAVILGGAAVFWLAWNWVDSALTLLLAGYILVMSVGMLKRTASILMEGTPEGIDVAEVRSAVESIAGVSGIHHVHIWDLDEHVRALEAHVVVDEGSGIEAAETLKYRIKAMLEEDFSIGHSTIELETVASACLTKHL